MRKRNKIFLLVAGLTGLIFVLVVLFYFSASSLLSSATVKEKIQAYLLEKTGAAVRYGTSDLQLFPLPKIIFQRVDISIPDKAEGTAESLMIYPGLWPLLRGDLQISQLSLEAPRFTVAISKDEEKPSLEFIEEKLRTVLRYIVTTSPGLSLSIRDGRLDLTESKEIAFTFDGIRSRLSASRKAVEIDLSCGSNLWDALSFSASLGADDLNGEGSVRLTGFHPDILAARLSPGTGSHIKIPDADLSVKFSALGLRQMQASVESSSPAVSIARGRKQILLKDAKIKGEIGFEPNKVSVTLGEANIGHPAIILSGQYAMDKDSGMMTLDVAGKSIAVLPVRDSALAFAGDIPLIETIFDYLRDGQIPSVHFHASGKSLDDLGRTENIRVSGNLLGGTVYVPARDLLFQKVDGDVDISRGILEGSNVRAYLKNNRCSKGTLKIGLKGKDALFHIDLLVKADVGELPALIRDKQLVENEAFLREMDRLHDLRGTAEGRLTLGDRLDSVHVKIAVDTVNVTTRYEPLPFPLSITGGQFLYDEKSIKTVNLSGSIGNSSFSRLTGSLTLERPYNLEMTGGQMQVSADEIYSWITSFEGMKPVLNTVRSVSGILVFSSVSFRGPLYEPSEWRFNETGEARRVALDASFLPGRTEEISGSFRVTHDRLFLKDMRAKILDSLITVDGSFTEFPADIRTIDLTLKGNVGPEVLPWITSLANLPPEIRLRAPFTVTDATVSWEKEKKTAFDGRLIFGRETKVSLSLTKTPDSLSVRNIAIKDSTSDADAEVTLNNEAIDAAFRGAVTSNTMDTIFSDSILSGAALEGDMKAHIVIKKPNQSSAAGTLKGRNIPIPWDRNTPLVVKEIDLGTDGQNAVINRAQLAVGHMQFSAKGTVSGMPSWHAVDLDLSSEGFDWESLENIFGDTERKVRKKEKGLLKDIPVRGTLRLRSDFFRYGQFTWEPFHADITFDGKTALLKINKAALCNVSSTGDLRVTDQGITFDIALGAKDLEFRPTILCLTNKHADYTGTFGMEARLKGEGPIDEIKDRLNGTFSISAKDGKILKSESIDRTLDLLNKSENLKGQFPDIEKEIISYSVLDMRGTIEGQKIHIKEGVLDTSVMGITAQGSIDLDNETIDLNALVAPFKTVHWIVRHIPILGHILGGNLVSVPVKLSGDLKDPKITFLSPSAVGSEILGILGRTIKLPITLIEPIFPAAKEE